MSYKKALKKLESLPSGERQLASGQYVWAVKKGKSHCGCAIGKLLPERVRRGLFAASMPVAPFIQKPNESGVSALRGFLGLPLHIEGGADSGIAGMTFDEACALQGENDRALFYRNTHADRKARYRRVLAWLREQISLTAEYDANGGVES